LIWLENVLLPRVDLVITVGEKLRRYFAARHARRSVVVANSKRLGDFSRTEHEISQIRQRLAIPNGVLTVVCITQLLDDRKIDELLGAAEHCANVYVIIGGKGV